MPASPFPLVKSNALPEQKFQAFLCEGREIVSAAQLIESGDALCEDALDYAVHMTNFALPAAGETPALEHLLRALFQKHAKTHGIRLNEAIARHLPKMCELYGEARIAPLQDLHLIAEWEWDT